MRVLMITEASSAGVGRHVMDLCATMIDAGHDVHLAYSEARADDAFRHELAELGDTIQSVRIKMRRGQHPTDLRALRAYCKAHGPFDIVHGQSSKGGALARLLGRRSSAATIYTPHCVYTLNPSAGRLARAIYGRAELWLSRLTDATIAVSPDEESHLVELGFPRAHVHCVPNGIRAQAWPARDEARAHLGLPADTPVIAFLARLSKQKNPLMMLEAFAHVAQRDAKTRLAIAGSGELEDACRARAAELGLEERVDWLGYRRAHELMPAADVFALSSRYEGMPYVYLEALSCGLPIVSARVGGVDLAVRDGVNGRIIAQGDVAGFGAALHEVISDTERCREMARASREREELPSRAHVRVDDEGLRRSSSGAFGS